MAIKVKDRRSIMCRLDRCIASIPRTMPGLVLKTFSLRSIAAFYFMHFLVMFMISSYSHITVTVGLVLVDLDADQGVTQETSSQAQEMPQKPEHEIQHEDGMQWRIQEKPSDCLQESELGDRLEVHYTGYLENGMIFDSSVKNERPPIGLTLGAKQVIEGWEKGLIGMCVGERRRLIVPPHLAYGDAGYPPSIPPRAVLLFEVTLVSLQKRNTWSHNINCGINMIKLFGPPMIVFYLMYFLWSRYKTEMAEQKGEKKRAKKRK